MDGSDEASSIDGSEEESGGSSPENWSEEAEHRRLMSPGKKDRISALPDSLIQHIISFLPSTKQAIRTGILSRRWYNQWSHVPVLILNSSGMKNFSRFIDRTLVMHDCSKLKKFQLHHNWGLMEEPELITLLRFAVRKHVEELIIHPCSVDYKRDVYILPGFLRSNDALVKLELFNCYFDHYLRPNWPNLKEFKLKCDISLLGVGAIKNVVSGCPSLECLELRGFNFLINDGIASKSLKRLILIDANCDKDRDCFEISCPNLEEFCVKLSWLMNLEFSTLPNQKIEKILSSCPLLHTLKLEDVNCSEQFSIVSKSLKKLCLRRLHNTLDIEILCPNLMEANLYDFEPPNNAYENLEIRMLGQLQHVKFLEIGSSMMKNLTALEVEDRSSLFLNCNSLTLDGRSFDDLLPGFLRAIRSSPMLEKLYINFPRHGINLDLDDHITNYWKSKETSFGFSMPSLKTVKLDGLTENNDQQKHVFKFIEFLLKNSPVLKNLVIILSSFNEPGFLVEVSKKLLGLQRCYPHKTIELCPTMFKYVEYYVE